ncbi:ACD11-like protein [Hibiscus syriacus]|uniref:ACD11-like protein n=1 Tax=Hibiscus syriacus TaxID=106335 RepID=A0A6A2YPW1_HIBSY|nr:ACD11 homolog protein-like [Hibiscus syriacus]KAE8681305.1 ACD11-like protein [Hibiscus syriacus]
MDEANGGSNQSQTKMSMTTKTPLSDIAEAFEELSELLGSQNKDQELPLDTFCEACSLVSVLFSCLGLAFKFAELEYVAKVHDLVEASKRFATLENVLDLDVANDTVKTPGSHSRNLRRVRQGLDLIRALFEEFVSSDCYSLRDAASTAYAQVCAPYHTWTVRTAVSAGMYTLPTREELLIKLNETDHTAEKKMKRYIEASRPVLSYIDKLYISRNVTLDW